MSWLDLRIDGIARIDRVAALFEVWAPEAVPFSKFKVKVVERKGSDFAGFTNVAIRNPRTGEPEGIAGLGSSIEDALQDVLQYFLRQIEENDPGRPLKVEDFAWSAPEDF